MVDGRPSNCFVTGTFESQGRGPDTGRVGKPCKLVCNRPPLLRELTAAHSHIRRRPLAGCGTQGRVSRIHREPPVRGDGAQLERRLPLDDPELGRRDQGRKTIRAGTSP